MSNYIKRAAVLGTLSAVSVGYDLLIVRRAPTRWMEKYTWLLVVVGVLYTLGGLAVLDRRAARLALLTFVFSGWPMAAGDLLRWAERQRNGRAAVDSIIARHGIRDR